VTALELSVLLLPITPREGCSVQPGLGRWRSWVVQKPWLKET